MRGKEKALSAEELSRVLGVSEFTVKRLARAGELPREYVGGRPRFRLRELFRYFRKLEGGAA
jgi:excisionase family DNA binding protein